MYLIIPSLEEKRLLFVNHVSQTEATMFAENFTNRVKESRKLVGADSSNVDNDIVYLEGFFDLSSLDSDDFTDVDKVLSIGDILQSLAISNVQGTRGARVVFLDTVNNVIGVGTTVVYNRNWATLNFENPDILDEIDNVLSENGYDECRVDFDDLDNPEDESDDSSPSISWY